MEYRFTKEGRYLGFSSPSLANQFRQTAYSLVGLEIPSKPGNSITFLSSVASEMVRSAHSRIYTYLYQLLSIANLWLLAICYEAGGEQFGKLPPACY